MSWWSFRNAPEVNVAPRAKFAHTRGVEQSDGAAGVSAPDPDVPSGSAENAPAASGPPAQGPPAARPSSRGSRRVRDMVLSLVVTGGMVLALFLVVWRPNSGDSIKAVDWQSAVTSARTTLDWQVLAPSKLPVGWTATSARVAPVGRAGAVEWYLGVVTVDGNFLALAQSDVVGAAKEKWLGERTLNGVVADPPTTVLSGRVWERRLNSPRDEHSLITPVDPTTVVVSGSATDPEMESFIALLTAS